MCPTKPPASLIKLADKICKELTKNEIDFAIAGGICADFYRGEPRATEDIDVLVALDETNIELAKEILRALGYSVKVVTKAMLKGDTRFRRKSRKATPQIVIGREEGFPYGVDLLLLTFPWAKEALRRAQQNIFHIDGVGEVPCLTVEDMIISKLFAIKNNSSRRYRKSDIPDIALMLENNTNLDLAYLTNSMENLELIIPKGLEQDVDVSLSRLSKKLRRKNKTLDY